ncbi:hypothetical protein [Pseudogemmobacter sonorensis]|uniref:hypothetical protein n=1 Tax=Pseudogemmobacter sonorensis TaxID=2989681 RepID=UPI00369CAFED
MMPRALISKKGITLWAIAYLVSFNPAPAHAITDAEIRQMMIEDSLWSYPGNCPCPENRDSAGRRCGKRSAYSKPGGYVPLCYPSDISEPMLDEYARRKGISRD